MSKSIHAESGWSTDVLCCRAMNRLGIHVDIQHHYLGITELTLKDISFFALSQGHLLSDEDMITHTVARMARVIPMPERITIRRTLRYAR
jgi:hypothetical protein